jgi:hypothetical protein
VAPLAVKVPAAIDAEVTVAIEDDVVRPASSVQRPASANSDLQYVCPVAEVSVRSSMTWVPTLRNEMPTPVRLRSKRSYS